MGAAPTKRVRPNTSVYVTGLPLDAGLHEIAEVFARYGVLLEDDDGRPRVKLYHDPATQAFKGEALVVYFKPESVELAIQLLDDTYLRAAKGVSSGPRMKVERAEFHESPSKNDEEKRTLTESDKKNIRRRMHRMQKYVQGTCVTDMLASSTTGIPGLTRIVHRLDRVRKHVR